MWFQKEIDVHIIFTRPTQTPSPPHTDTHTHTMGFVRPFFCPKAPRRLWWRMVSGRDNSYLFPCGFLVFLFSLVEFLVVVFWWKSSSPGLGNVVAYPCSASAKEKTIKNFEIKSPSAAEPRPCWIHMICQRQSFVFGLSDPSNSPLSLLSRYSAAWSRVAILIADIGRSEERRSGVRARPLLTGKACLVAGRAAAQLSQLSQLSQPRRCCWLDRAISCPQQRRREPSNLVLAQT